MIRSRILLVLSSIILLTIGIAGLILPGLQGIAFIVTGLLLLGQAIPAVARWQRRLEQRSPRFSRLVARFRNASGTLRIGKMLVTMLILSGVWAGLVYVGYLLFDPT